ncbi:MAG: universal stress protein [Chloroflexi bacterium]|nr:universal stress protein [Chloroflexota bacterium]MBI3734444.1 universal stress protein [Chloroflexota bacterium]
MITKILVPLDGSPTAEAVLEPVLSLARQLQAEVTLLAIESGQAALPATYERQVYEERAYLKVQVLAFEEQGLTAHYVVRTGDPAAEIVDYATVNKMDMIAMSTHGRTGLTRALMGSVAETVVRQSSVPVLLVRA